MPYGFALHTTSATLGLATIDHVTETGANRLAPTAPTEERVATYDLGRQMLAHLHTHVRDFVAPRAWQDCAFVAVAKGPGSFTSTRIGVTAARTLGQQLQVPVFAISTLEAVAFADTLVSKEEIPRIPYAVSLDAARGERFGGIYCADRDGSDITCRRADEAMMPEAWAEIVRDLGDVLELEVTPETVASATASLITLAAWRWQRGDRPHWSAATPFYGQHPVQ